MPASPVPVESGASRLDGTQPTSPGGMAGKARSTLNPVRHDLTGRTFFLLPDEDPAEFRAHEARWLAEWRPRDLAEQDVALLAIRSLWREMRADRLEARILADLFAADALEDEAAGRAARAAAMRALATLLRYRAQIERESAAAMRDLTSLSRRKLAPAQPARRDEPEPIHPANDTDVRDEPEHPLNRHQRRALAAMQRRQTA
ncbi:MAG: hypothetical protein AB7I59_00655 [Geminicoccaceae bacterium]